jgi:hypothetical protein
MGQKGNQSSRERPYGGTTRMPESYDTKARLGAMHQFDDDYMVSEELNLGSIPGPNQDNNGGFKRGSAGKAPTPNISRPQSGGIGGPLE